MPGRLLRLLSLLQSRREWSGRELAERLGVTERTLRRDIERLRALDYPVFSATGTFGGYWLASGRNLPPLLLDDQEAIAVATGLVTAAGGSVADVAESATRALAKLEQVLPERLRPRLSAMATSAAAVPGGAVPRVDPAVLALLASCCRDREVVSFDYDDRSGEPSARRVEPYHLVTVRGLWYLLAYDPDRAGWRTFRLDRMRQPACTRRSFPPRELPAPDAVTYLTRSFARASYRYTARISVALPADAVRERIVAPVLGEIDADGRQRCTLRVSAESAELVAQYVAAVAALGAELVLDAPDEVRRRVRAAGTRLLA